MLFMASMYRVEPEFQACNDSAKARVSKKHAGRMARRVLIRINYGAFVVAGAFVAGADPPEGAWLQPVITALKARPNSTTKDSFFIGSGNLYWFPKKHK